MTAIQQLNELFKHLSSPAVTAEINLETARILSEMGLSQDKGQPVTVRYNPDQRRESRR